MRRLFYIFFLILILLPSTGIAYNYKVSFHIPLKDVVVDMSLNPVTGRVLVADKEGSLYLINEKDGTIIATIGIKGKPVTTAIYKKQDMAFVLTSDSTVYVVDMKKAEIVGLLSGDDITAMSFDNEAGLLLLGEKGRIMFIEPDSDQEREDIPIDGMVKEIFPDRDALIALVQRQDGYWLQKIRLSEDNSFEEIQLQTKPDAISIDMNMGVILISCGGVVEVYDRENLQFLWQSKHESTHIAGMAVDPLTGTVFLAETEKDRIALLDIREKSQAEMIAGIKSPSVIRINSFNNRAWIAHKGGIEVLELENPIPVIDRLIPSAVHAGEDGFTLRIEGKNFLQQSLTRFNEDRVPSRFISNQTLKAEIARDKLLKPGDVPVTVTNPPPGGGVSNTYIFKVYNPAPVLDSVSPEEIPAGQKVKIRLRGRNFFNGSRVNFNGINLKTSFISSILLEAEVPETLTGRSGKYPIVVINPSPGSFTSNAMMLTISERPLDNKEQKQRKTKKEARKAVRRGSLKGRILNTDNKPLKGVTIRVKGIETKTDEKGYFFISGIPSGKRVVLIDGSTTENTDLHYPTIPVTVEIKPDMVNSLPFQPYLHWQKAWNFKSIDHEKVRMALKRKHSRVFNSTDEELPDERLPEVDSDEDLVIKDEFVPGVELRIPKGTRIIGWDGQANQEVSIRTVPPDRLPVAPLPEEAKAKSVFMFYFSKIGGGVPDRPIPFKAPNDLGLLPGEKAVLWYYDESPNEGEAPNNWAVAGTGTVTADGRYIVADPGVGIPKFCCGATAWGGTGRNSPKSTPEGDRWNPDITGPTPPCGKAGDPVDLGTGYFLHTATDFYIPGLIPVKLKRYYRSGDSGIGMFGRGTYFEYDWWMGEFQDMLLLIKPGNYQYQFPLQTDGTYRNERDPSMHGAVATVNADGTKTLRMPNGKIYRFDASGDLYEIEDPNGNKLSLIRRSDFQGGYLQEIIMPDGRRIIFNQSMVNNTFRTDEIVLPGGKNIIYTYDSSSRLISVQYPDGTSVHYSYDSSGRLSEIINRRGIRELLVEYDSEDRVVRQTHADGGVYTFNYTVAGGNVTETVMTDPEGNTTRWRFNSYGYITEVTTSDGTVMYERQPWSNRIITITDPLGRVTAYTYNGNGSVEQKVDNNGNITTYQYDQVYTDKPTKVIDALGGITTYEYDSQGNVVSITDPLGNTTRISYNGYGKPVGITDPLGNTTTFEYDHYGNLIKVTDPEGGVTEMSYDALGHLIRVRDPEGNTTEYVYDLSGRPVEVKAADGGVTRFSYDENGNLLSVTDANGHTIRYEYDERDRLVKMTDQLGRVETYEYDYNDNLIRHTDRKGQVTTYTYGSRNRIVRVDYADGSYTTYSYDQVGRLTEINDSVSGYIRYEYADTGCSACGGGGVDKVIQEITPLGSISYEYDALGRRTKMQVAGQPAVNYQYDAAGRLLKISTLNFEHGMLEFSFGYDALGRRTSLTYPNGVTTTYTYDKASRLLNLEHLNPLNQILEKISYLYDKNGNRVAMDRLNVTPKLSTPVVNATYNEANQMLTFQPEGDTEWQMSYDENGNLTSVTNSCGTTNFIWDARNRLIGINGFTADCSPLTANFKYDALGRRIEKTTNGETIQYLYDGLNIVQEIKDGMVYANYIRTLNIDEPLGRIKSDGTIRYYHADALGSVIALTDEIGNVRTQYTYSPFGETETLGELSDNPFQYTGRENDNTGLYYYRFRYYSPELKRFISEDPIGLMGGNVNYYVYVWNSPNSSIDPLGLKKGDWWDPRTYISISYNVSYMGEGKTISNGIEQKTFTIFDLVGASIDINIGILPTDNDLVAEFGFGLGDFLGIGFFFARPNAFGSFDIGGITIHIGLGVGLPVYISGTLPKGEVLKKKCK